MVVTDIMPLDSGRRRVCLDDGTAFPLYSSELRKFHLEAGSSLSQDDLARINELLVKRVRERILYLIDSYDRPERELFQKMTRAGYPERIISDAIAQLKEARYIDDVRYAQNYIAVMQDRKGKSVRAIEKGLLEKGISRDIIETLLSRSDSSKEQAFIIRFLRKKGYRESDIKMLDYPQKQRLYAALMRRGFQSFDIASVFAGKGDWQEN